MFSKLQLEAKLNPLEISTDKDFDCYPFYGHTSIYRQEVYQQPRKNTPTNVNEGKYLTIREEVESTDHLG
jgi:hypothetical protein